MDKRDRIVRRIVQDLRDGDYVNLGIGMPTLVWLLLAGILICATPSLRGESPGKELIEVGKIEATVSRRFSRCVVHECFPAWYVSGSGVSYAESDDGLRWVKPPLDLVTIEWAKTNILFRRLHETKGPEALPHYHELFGVHKDEREPDPSRRYKMGFLSIDWEYKGPREGRFREGQRRGLGIAGSPDGIHWKLIDSFASEAILDGATHWMFDPALGKYVLYGRTLKTPPEIEAAWSKYVAGQQSADR